MGGPNVPEFGSIKDEAGDQARMTMLSCFAVNNDVRYSATMLTTCINDVRVVAHIPAKIARR